MKKNLSHSRIALAFMLVWTIGQMCGCSESAEIKDEQLRKERDAHIEAEQAKFVARYPGSKDFEQFRSGFVPRDTGFAGDERHFSIDLQKTISESPDQVYWIKTNVFSPDVVARSKGPRVEFGFVDMFSLGCSEELISELRKMPFPHEFSTNDELSFNGPYLLAFKISGMRSSQILDDKQDDVDRADVKNVWLIDGTLLDVQRVSEVEKKQ